MRTILAMKKLQVLKAYHFTKNNPTMSSVQSSAAFFLLVIAITCYAISREDFEREFLRRLNSDPENMRHWALPANAQATNTEISVLLRFTQETNERVEALIADIRNPLPAPGTRVNFGPSHTQYMRNVLGGREGDERGHILAHSLGGPAHNHNLFPQHRCSNRNYNVRHLLLDWYNLEQAMRDHMNLHMDNRVEFRVLFDFPDESVGFPNYNRPRTVHVNARFINRFGLLDDEYDFYVENRPGVFVEPSLSKIYKKPPPTTTHMPFHWDTTVIDRKFTFDIDRPNYICHFWAHKA
uniref:Type VII secretion system protein EssD-like domain-containing protein n=1 Tax=Romanomermis culicivorax TaxID=13658 RepID=A0A915HZZ5_ROMCU